MTGVALGGALTALTPAAPAMADHDRFGKPSEGMQPPPSGSRAVGIAASKAGTPYAYGAEGPGAFDCSGFTGWVWSRLGRDLPRTSAAQAGATQRIAARDARPGDLVFFTGSGGVYHVGIYAGDHAVWHAPRPGEGVQRDRIWTSSVFYGRVR
jgi:cell wall-associated NlpC family hydrolase